MTTSPAVELGDVVDFRAGTGFPVDLQGCPSGQIPFAKVGDISRHGRAGARFIETADNYVAEVDLVRLRATPVPPGSTLFAKIGEAIRHNHRVIAGCPMLVDNNAMAAIPRDGLDPIYLYRFLQTVDLYRSVSTTTVPSLRKSDLERITIPLPPLPEQRRIAAILDRADALRTKRRQVITHLDDLAQSIFLDMFGEPSVNKMRWPMKPLGEIVSNRDSIRIPLKISERSQRAGAYPYYGASGIIDFVDDYLFEGDYLLVSEDGANLLARSSPIAFIASGRFWVNNHAHVLASIGVAELSYLETAIARVDIKNYLTGSTQPKLTRSALDRIELPLPPSELQNEFVRRTDAVSEMKIDQGRLQELDELLFASLQSRAFSGAL